MIRPLIERSLDCCKRAFEDAGLKPSDVSEVLFVGGSTRIPLVQAEVERYFGRAPNHSLNPDEDVALGAAIQGGVLAGDVHDIVLLDVTPLTLGVEANGGLMISLIDRNTTIPTKKTKLFSTTVDNQESVTINVYQGERHFAAENRFLGQFELAGIEPAPRAVPQIEVAFDIDANGVLRVSATNKKTNKTESLVLMGAGGLTDDEIRSAIADAEAAREADEARKAHLVAKNKLQSFVFSISRLQRENSDLASDELKKMTPPLLERADAVLANDDVTTEELEAMSNELSACSCQWYDCVYEKEKADREREEAEKAAQQQQQGPQGPQPGTENM
jgi:molecular chaperone DnaK